MRRMLAVALLCAGCGSGGDGLVGGTWEESSASLQLQALVFRDDGHYSLQTAGAQGQETGAWTTDAAGLHLEPDGAPAYPAMEFSVKGDHLRIWWPAHTLHEYDRQ